MRIRIWSVFQIRIWKIHYLGGYYQGKGYYFAYLIRLMTVVINFGEGDTNSPNLSQNSLHSVIPVET